MAGTLPWPGWALPGLAFFPLAQVCSKALCVSKLLSQKFSRFPTGFKTQTPTPYLQHSLDPLARVCSKALCVSKPVQPI